MYPVFLLLVGYLKHCIIMNFMLSFMNGLLYNNPVDWTVVA